MTTQDVDALLTMDDVSAMAALEAMRKDEEADHREHDTAAQRALRRIAAIDKAMSALQARMNK